MLSACPEASKPIFETANAFKSVFPLLPLFFLFILNKLCGSKDIGWNSGSTEVAGKAPIYFSGARVSSNMFKRARGWGGETDGILLLPQIYLICFLSTGTALCRVFSSHESKTKSELTTPKSLGMILNLDQYQNCRVGLYVCNGSNQVPCTLKNYNLWEFFGSRTNSAVQSHFCIRNSPIPCLWGKYQ